MRNCVNREVCFARLCMVLPGFYLLRFSSPVSRTFGALVNQGLRAFLFPKYPYRTLTVPLPAFWPLSLRRIFSSISVVAVSRHVINESLHPLRTCLPHGFIVLFTVEYTFISFDVIVKLQQLQECIRKSLT